VIVETDWVQGSALAIRRDLYREIGGMDPAFFLYFDDVDLCERVRARGLKVVEVRDLAYAIEHDERAYVKYHSRVKIYAWHRACAHYHEKHGRPAWLVRSLVGLRATLRLGFWSAARLLRRIDADVYRMRLLGYTDTLKFLIGRPPPLPFELLGQGAQQTDTSHDEHRT
jgi:GT2 family glycosyltransferase